jgi:hypothetical protein
MSEQSDTIITIPLSAKQIQKISLILANTQDEGPEGEGWATEELKELREIFKSYDNAIDQALLILKDNLELSNIELCKINAKQGEELKVLRGFAKSVCEYTVSERTRLDFVRFGLCDNEWKPTKLLTGEK